MPKVVTQRCLEQDLNLRPTDRKPKRLTRYTTAPPYPSLRPENSSQADARVYMCISGQQLVEEYACFNTIFEIVCPSDSDVVIFETARYGRNDTLVAALCEIPFTRNCDVDVHFLLNRACAGRRKCSIVVNTAFFGDPCGYEEFLKVTYRCVPGTGTAYCRR